MERRMSSKILDFNLNSSQQIRDLEKYSGVKAKTTAEIKTTKQTTITTAT
jgi:hypothetical protein